MKIEIEEVHGQLYRVISGISPTEGSESSIFKEVRERLYPKLRVPLEEDISVSEPVKTESQLESSRRRRWAQAPVALIKEMGEALRCFR
jgi:ACT domain-containing protein